MSADMRVTFLRTLCLAGLIAVTSLPAASAAPRSQSTSPAGKAHIVEVYGNLPLRFEANTGQADKNVRFLSRGSGHGLYLTSNEAALTLCQPFSAVARQDSRRSIVKPSVCDVVRMRLAGASSTTNPVGDEQMPGVVNYFTGSDPAKWRSNIPTYAKVHYRGIYPGIDLVYYGNQQQVEFDFVVAPHADPRLIRLRLGGASTAHLAPNGDAVVTTTNGKLAFHKPLIYQMVDGHRRPVAGEFAWFGKHTLGFRLGSYDRAKALVIDPVLEYSTFLGGSGNPYLALIGGNAYAVAVDAAGNAYVTGGTVSTDFPTTPGAFQKTNRAANGGNVFVTKLNPAGTELIYSTYLGGSNSDQGNAIAVDAAGDAYVTGWTYSTDFPVTAGAFQISSTGAGNGGDAFITELNPTGTALVYSTYLGGSLATAANAIALDAAGDAYVAGQTGSADFPVTAGAFQSQNKAAANKTSNAFVTELNPAGSALLYSTYLGGSGAPVVFGNIGTCRSAQFVPTGEEDGATAIAVDAAGNAYVTGTAVSTDFPVTAGAYQTQNSAAANQLTNAFVAKLNPSGTALVYSTYLGGSGAECTTGSPVTPYAGDASLALAVDSAGDAYVAGIAFSSDFPVTPGALQSANRFSYTKYGGSNAFVAKLNPSGTGLVYSTYLGGSGGFTKPTPDFYMVGGDQATGLAIDNSGNAYITGSTASADFPVTQNAYQATNNYPVDTGYNTFLAELNPAGAALAYSTYLGGNGSNPNVESGESIVEIGDTANALALDGSGNVYVVGAAESANFPASSGAFQTTIQAAQNAFVAKLNVGPSFAITGAAVTVTAGATSGNTSAITVTPANGFTGNVALTAAVTSSPSGAQDPPTFSFGSTSPVNISGPAAGTATLTINTTAAVGCSQAKLTPHGTPWSTAGGAFLATIVFLGSLPRRRSRRSIVGLLLLLVTLAGGLLACGGSGGRSICNLSTAGTTPGTYTITVTGTSGATAAPGTVTLVVQ